MQLKRPMCIFFIVMAFLSHWEPGLSTNQKIPLTLESVVDIAMNNSYRIKQLQLGIQRRTFWLKARKAGLKSKVFMNLKTPDLNKISDYKWNSLLYRDEIVRQNTQLWQSDLSIEQPTILFGYPTNGYVSLNYTIYRYLQKENEDKDISYYNRLYMKFEQPFFLPNVLKNELEEAELDLEDVQLDFIEERVEIIEDISDDYYDAFELAYYNIVYQDQMKILKKYWKLPKN